MDEKDKIIIHNLIEDKKSLWTVIIVLTGGIVGLVASINGLASLFQIIFRSFFSIFGSVILYFMVMNLISVTNQIQDRLNK